MAQRWPCNMGGAARHGANSVARLTVLLVALVFCSFFQTSVAQNIDGGRSELPGMKQDMFDQVNRNKKGQSNNKVSKGPPDCKRSDGYSPFVSLGFVAGKDIYVRLNSTEGKCERLISISGANYSELKNYSLTCGPVGEWKQRIAENMSSVFFQGGWDWVVNDNDTVEVITEESGAVTVEVSEAKYEEMMKTWRYGGDCEQAKSPATRAVFFTLLAIAVVGLGYDGFKVAYEKLVGKKPPKHVLSKKGHRMEEVKQADNHFCDSCGGRGTTYQCSGGSNYDMCTKCYKSAKKEVKAAWEKWCEKHPEDKKEKEKKKKKDEKDSDAENSKSDADDKSGAEDKSGTETGKDDEAEEDEDTKADE